MTIELVAYLDIYAIRQNLRFCPSLCAWRKYCCRSEHNDKHVIGILVMSANQCKINAHIITPKTISAYFRATSSSLRNSAKHAILYSYRTVHPSGLNGRAMLKVPSPATGLGYDDTFCECRLRLRLTRFEWAV